MAKKYQSKVDYNKFKATLIIFLVMIICCMGIGLFSLNRKLKNSVSSDQAVYLQVFDELAGNFAKNLDVNADYDETVYMTGYGVSKEDGKFYIAFEYTLLDEEGNPVSEEVKSGKVYFWDDAKTGKYSYAFSYDE